MNVTKFEDLPNELCLANIFISFDLCSLYFTFYNLNSRYNRLISACSKLQLDMEKIPVSRSIEFIYKIEKILPSGSIVSLKNANTTQVNFLSADRTFQRLIVNIKSITLISDISISSVYELLWYVEVEYLLYNYLMDI